VPRATTVRVMILGLYERKVLSSAESKYAERHRFHVKLRKFYGVMPQIQFSARATYPLLWTLASSLNVLLR